MGDRANVAVVQYEGDALVYLYTHWGGTELPIRVQQALAKGRRWDDSPYLTRIIFDTMTKNCQGQETGFGISTHRPDNEHPIIVVDTATQLVGFAHEGQEPDCYKSWTFSEYTKLSLEEIGKHYK